MTPPNLSPGNRPAIGSKGVNPGIGNGGIGNRPGIGSKGVDPGFGKGGIGDRPGIGSKGVDPGFGKGGIANRPGLGGPGGVGGPGGIGKGGVGSGVGNRPSVLPGLGLGAAGGILAGKAGDALGRRQGNIQDRKENLGERSQNLQDRLDQRQEFRSQAQDKRQEYMENRREDWQNWHDDYYGHYDGWYHGAWGDAWSHMWSEHTAAMVLGTTMWGLNRMGYWFGTGAYENPYYSEPLVIDNTTISYAEPLVAAPPVTSAEPAAPTSELPPGVTAGGLEHFNSARAAFYEGNYQKSLEETNKALATMPKDAVIHEFRALALFALGKYHDAAVTLHPVLAVGPGWDWTTMSSLYPDIEIYTKQLRALESVVTADPKAADAAFVLAYHYLTLGHNDSAAKQLTRVQKLIPNDTVSAQLLQMMGKSPDVAPPVTESTAKIDAAQVQGTWTAKRGGKASFELTLEKDKGFTWVYREGKKREEVKGAYALDGNVLALEPDAGGVMLAEITAPQNGSFDFRTVGAPKSEQGLKFQKK
jgi:tetratricopeptide (TPR) repeat protein